MFQNLKKIGCKLQFRLNFKIREGFRLSEIIFVS